MLREQQSIFLRNITKLIEWAFANGYELTSGEFYRPPEMQKIYFDTGKSKTMTGYHPQRLAADFNLFINGELKNAPIDYKPLGDYWESLHSQNRWGGDWNRNDDLSDEKFKDPYHFEMRV